MSQADYTYMLKAGNMVSIEPEYLLMPESSGVDIEQNIKTFCEWLFRELSKALHSINRNLEVDWNCLSIFGESFGGLLAMMLYLEIGCCASRPPKLRISGVFLRCPLSEAYKREEGLYCGKPISRESARRNSQAIDETLKKMQWVEPRVSTPPPNGMAGAYYLSVSDCWKQHWNAPLLPERIKKADRCPDMRTRIYIKHGTDDRHVPLGSSRRLAAVLQEKWPFFRVEIDVVEGKEHAWDRSDPLTDNHERILTTM
jgi:hypothetical protein